jgi:hypothetical protein
MIFSDFLLDTRFFHVIVLSVMRPSRRRQTVFWQAGQGRCTCHKEKEPAMASKNQSVNLSTASHQWATRPDDQRYTSLQALKEAVADRKRESWTVAPKLSDLRVTAENNEVRLDVFDPNIGERHALLPTHWGFGQLAQYAQAPAAYLRKLPAEIAAINLQWGLERNPLKEDALVMAQSNGDNVLRSVTSTSYGRIWDLQVVEAVERIHNSGNWKVPAASYATQNPKRASTLYPSDRDVFIFLVDDAHPIEFNGENLFRGFYVWNSEVGAATFGICSFLYQFVCDNRTIWGATDIRELRIKHTGGAPERFASEGARMLHNYANESTARITDGLKRAAAAEIEDASKGEETITTWLQKRGFTKPEAKASFAAGVAERGEVRSVWDIVNGITAHARSIVHADERVNLEARAGRLLEAAAA